MGCPYLTLVLCLIFCFHVWIGDAEKSPELSCHANNACSSLRNVTCRFKDLGLFESFPEVDSLTNKPWPSPPLCHNITAVQHQNGSEILLNITWKGPSDASFQKLKGFYIETTISSNAYPIGSYFIDLKNDVDLFKDDALFGTIQSVIFEMMCVFRPRARGSSPEPVNFDISSVPSPMDEDDVNTCQLIYFPVTISSSQTESIFLPTMTAPSSLVSSDMLKHDDQRKSVATATVISLAVCSMLLVIIVTIFLYHQRKHNIQRISITKNECMPSISSSPLEQTIPPTDNPVLWTADREIAEHSVTSRQSDTSSEDPILDDEISREMLRINFGTFDKPLCEVEHYL
ncbi:uncharacterized protein LOC125652911 [Ostrea edulis]|uniref:uncharacterized protein LOC125652911 n=1 Tax=Ostrea edulis TaxID=37623 RepID=UPI0024AFF64F|nr:uncharacterized protein LOC125652911 [Ostrea edulis]